MAAVGESINTVTQSVTSLSDALMQMLYSIIAYLPNIIAAIIILLIGWVVGRLLGKYISRFLDKIGVDDALLKTSVGKAIEQTGTSVVDFFNIIVRWFVYLIAILAAANVLQLDILTNLLHAIVIYLPNILVFLIILIAGFILVDYFADFLSGWGRAQKVAFMDPIVMALRIFLYFIIVMLALTQLLIDLTIIYIFLTPIAWGVGIGIGAGIAVFLAYGLKDRAPEIMDNILGKIPKE
jgi:small-conductance mechanosensitive channel